MNIAVVTPVYSPYRGGTGTLAALIAELCAKQGHEVIVLTPRIDVSSLREEKQGGVTIRRLSPLIRFGNAAFVPQILIYLWNADVVHLHYPFAGAELPVILWQRLRHKSLYLSYHNDLIGGTWWMKVIFFVYTHTLEPLLFHCVSHFFVTSLDYARHSHLKSLLRRHEDRFVEVPGMVDTDFFSPSMRKEKSEELRVLFVGALDAAHYFKGLDILIKACSRVEKKGKKLFLTIVGDGRKKISYEKSVRAIGLSHVSFLGSLTGVPLRDVYRSADVLALPSIDTESFGMVLVESMACGTPVIASNLPGVRTVVRNGATGFLVPPGDVEVLAEKIEWFCDHPMERHTMGVAARKQVEQQYALSAVSKKLLKTY